MSRAPAALALLAVAGLSLGAQCAGDPHVSFEVDLPASLSGTAQWMEVGVLPGSCPPPDQLAGGLPQTGLLDRIAFAKGDANPPAVGTIKKGSYAFAATARGGDCSVLATGCTEADLTSARDVAITLTATPKPLGACENGATCFDAQCTPSLGGPDASQGARCSMAFVAAGPLGDPVDPGSEVVSAPAAAWTGSGFLVAYREYDAAGGTAQLTFAVVGPSGALGLSAPAQLPTQCVNPGEADGLGLAFVGGAGTLVSARPQCGSQPAGFDALQVSATGKITGMAFAAAPGGQPTLSNAHALAMLSASSGWLAYLQGGRAHVTAFTGMLPQGSATTFGGGAPQTLAQVAATGQGVAVLAGGTGVNGDGGGTGPPTLDLALGTSPTTAGVPATFAGTAGALAMDGARAVALGASGTAGQPLAWDALDLGSATPSTSTFATPGPGAVAGVDVTLQGDLATLAVEQPGAVSLVVVDHASTTPTLLRTVLLAGDARVPSQANVRDGKVAVAMGGAQVLVAWVTASQLGVNDAVGGWALYACAP
jgi:hypothetical protein